MSGYAGVRLLPNAITVLALCAGLSAVQYALDRRFAFAVAALALAALFDSLDGRIARLLDATSRMGAELDSLADCVSFGVAPALVLFVWRLHGHQFGWTVALVFAVCAALRLARFNTLIDNVEQPPYAKEFFVGVPAPAAALVAVLPLLLTLRFDEGWWSLPWVISGWMLLVAALMISRLRTLAMKTVRVPQKLMAPLLVLVGLAAAVVINEPFLALSLFTAIYLVHLPYASYRYRWLGRHPETWHVVGGRQRRAAARALRATRAPGLVPPLHRRVAGAARDRASGLRRRDQAENAARNGRSDAFGDGQPRRPLTDRAVGERPLPEGAVPRHSRSRLGLRKSRR